ncbi:MAG: type VI secretion system Vgr family protein, partial [Burkholderiaceae bacterium]|nr:type VI secretion system Vgr family protein [Burkholderiaceae bacterium]
TAGQLRMQLESEHAKTQLNMGYLVHPRDVSGEPRGDGFELRTDDWGALRAAKGLFITADGRYAAVGNALSRDELIICLQEALSLAKKLGASATQHEGNVSDPNPQEKLAKAVKDWGHGSNAEKGGNGGHPVVAVSSPAGIALGTPRSTTIATGEHIDTVAQKNQHITAGEKMNLHAQKGISQFAESGGIKSIAHQGKNIFQAHSDNIQIAADKNVKITASHDHVLIAADQYVALTSGGAYIKLAGGNIDIHCPGTVSIKGGNHTLAGPASMQAELPAFKLGFLFDEAFLLKNKDTGEILVGKKYRIKRADGSYEEGISDDTGHTHLVTTFDVETIEIQVQG